MDDAFYSLQQALESGGPTAGFEFLLQRFREEKKYAELFQARLMMKRHELELPLIAVGPLDDLPEDARRAYEECFVQAAREAGSLFLADGNIEAAWPYFRAIGEREPIAAAIEQLQPREGLDRVIEIAFYERVNVRKGLELILANYGLCRAITCFMQYPDGKGREECLGLLVRTLHRDLVRNLKWAIAQREGREPEVESVPALIAGRDWLFDDHRYYIDTSHLVSVLQFSLEATERETLELALEFTEYGPHLSSLYQHRLDPPFENVYLDHAVYLRAALGDDVDAAVAHFREKLTQTDATQSGSGPAQVVVRLLARLGRYAEAIEVSLEHLREVDPAQLSCPSVLQLCQLAGDHKLLMKLAKERGDLLNFAAGAFQAKS
jgi:hypothetical protein